MDDKQSTLGERLASAGMVVSDADVDRLSDSMSILGITAEQLMNVFSDLRDTFNAIAEIGRHCVVAEGKRTKNHSTCTVSRKSSYITPYRKITPTARSRLG